MPWPGTRKVYCPLSTVRRRLDIVQRAAQTQLLGNNAALRRDAHDSKSSRSPSPLLRHVLNPNLIRRH